MEDPGGLQLGVYTGQGLRRGVLLWGVYCNHLVGTLLQLPKKGKPKTLFANRGGVGLRARGFGPIPLASKQASTRERERERGDPAERKKERERTEILKVFCMMNWSIGSLQAKPQPPPDTASSSLDDDMVTWSVWEFAGRTAVPPTLPWHRRMMMWSAWEFAGKAAAPATLPVS